MKLSRAERAWAETGGSATPLLLTGAEAASLEERQTLLTQRLVCTQASACGVCGGCRMFTRGVHPDVTLFRTEEGGEKGVKELRRVLRAISRSPLHGRRVVLLPEVDQLSLPALNSLLKPLEEPAVSTRYILTSQFPGRLPETVLSRCAQVRVTGGKPSPSEESFDQLFFELSQKVREQGPRPELVRALMRLRDFYQIKAKKANVKLARHVVVAAVRQIDHTLAERYDA